MVWSSARVPAAVVLRGHPVPLPQAVLLGAGGGVDGQVLVMHDMLGMTHEFNPRFLRRYLDLYQEMGNAFSQYITDVKSGDFPNDEEQY